MHRTHRFHLSRRSFLGGSAAAVAWPLLAHTAHADTPPLRVIVPFAAGSPADLVLRAVGPRWTQRSGQALLIDHRPGAAGSLGAEAARRAEPDGHTLLLAPADVLVNNTAIFRALPYDPQRDFKPLALIGPVPLVLVVPATLGVRTLAEFQRWATRPRRIGYGSWGEGSHAHLLAEALLVRQLQLDAVHAPYRGLAPMLQDLIGGQLNAGFAVPPAAAPHVAGGPSAGAGGVGRAAQQRVRRGADAARTRLSRSRCSGCASGPPSWRRPPRRHRWRRAWSASCSTRSTTRQCARRCIWPASRSSAR